MRTITLTMTSPRSRLIIDKTFSEDLAHKQTRYWNDERATSIFSQLFQMDNLVKQARPVGPRLVVM